MIRIAFITRSTLYSTPGGDTIQIDQTAKHLKKSGIAVDILQTDSKINYNEYNLLHFFNITRPADILFHIAKIKIPFVISPILIDYSEYDRYHRKGVAGLILQQFAAGRNE